MIEYKLGDMTTPIIIMPMGRELRHKVAVQLAFFAANMARFFSAGLTKSTDPVEESERVEDGSFEKLKRGSGWTTSI